MDLSFWFHYRNLVTLPLSIGFLVVFIGIYIYAYTVKKGTYASITYYLGQVFVITSLINTYFNNLKYLNDLENEKYDYTRVVLFRNNTFVLGILFSTLAFNCIVHLPFLERLGNFIITKIGHLIQIILNFLIRHLKGKSYDPTPVPAPDTPTPTAYMMEEGSSKFSIIFETIISIIGVGLILIMLFLGIRDLIKTIRKLYYRYLNKEESKADSGLVETYEKLERPVKERKSIFKFNLDIREKIRKRYTQEIKHQMKQGYAVKNSDTPNERATDLEERLKSIDSLTDFYNVARYSDKPLDPKDWNEAKKHF